MLTPTVTSISLGSLGSLIDTLTTSGRSQDSTYNIYLETKPKSTMTNYYGKDFSDANWQLCKFYQLWEL